MGLRMGLRTGPRRAQHPEPQREPGTEPGRKLDREPDWKPDRSGLRVHERKSPGARWCCKSICRRRTHRESPRGFARRQAARPAKNRERSSGPGGPGTAIQTVCPPSRGSGPFPAASPNPRCMRSIQGGLPPPPPAARRDPAAPPDVYRAFRSPESSNVAGYFEILRRNTRHRRTASDALAPRPSSAGHARPPASWAPCWPDEARAASGLFRFGKLASPMRDSQDLSHRTKIGHHTAETKSPAELFRVLGAPPICLWMRISASCSFFPLSPFLLSWERPWLFSSAPPFSPRIFLRVSPAPSCPPICALPEESAGPPQRLGARK